MPSRARFSADAPYNALPLLPPKAELETKPVMKALVGARALSSKHARARKSRNAARNVAGLPCVVTRDGVEQAIHPNLMRLTAEDHKVPEYAVP